MTIQHKWVEQSAYSVSLGNCATVIEGTQRCTACGAERRYSSRRGMNGGPRKTVYGETVGPLSLRGACVEESL